jgi:glycosyltransferase involved in cell wall biosynthesis
MSKRTPLILASTPIEANHRFGLEMGQDAPRQDYVEIGRALGAQIMGPDLYDTYWYRRLRLLERRMKLNLAESIMAARRLSNHSAVLSTSERVAIPLAAMLKMSKTNTPHVVIGHKLSSRFKSSLFQVWPLHKSFDHLICVCRAQADFAVNELSVPASKVDFVYDKVDRKFFQPQGTAAGDFILSVGQEQRDYDTLLKAISSTGIKLVIVASSRWSDRQMEVRLNGTESVTVLSHISYRELRSLYAAARLVVVPLFDVSYAAGVNTVLEALAMAKPLIVSSTPGISDYVIPEETGKLVPPENITTLKDAIHCLWDRAGERKRLGENARQAIDERMNLDNYVDRVVKIMLEADKAREV